MDWRSVGFITEDFNHEGHEGQEKKKGTEAQSKKDEKKKDYSTKENTKEKKIIEAVRKL